MFLLKLFLTISSGFGLNATIDPQQIQLKIQKVSSGCTSQEKNLIIQCFKVKNSVVDKIEADSSLNSGKWCCLRTSTIDQNSIPTAPSSFAITKMHNGILHILYLIISHAHSRQAFITEICSHYHPTEIMVYNEHSF